MTTFVLVCVQGKSKARRVKTIYDCQADNDDELTFVEGEVIIVTGEEDQEWWVSIEDRPPLLLSSPLLASRSLSPPPPSTSRSGTLKENRNGKGSSPCLSCTS